MREADNLNTFVCQISWQSGNLAFLEPSGPHQSCYDSTLNLPFCIAFICSPMLCGWIFYFSCVVTCMQLYTAKVNFTNAQRYLYVVYCSCNIKSHCIFSTYSACSLYLVRISKESWLILTDFRTLQCLRRILFPL